MSYDRDEGRSFCAECCVFMLMIIIYTMLNTMYHVEIDEYNLDLWDRDHGLNQCCIRDKNGIIRNRETNKVEWELIVKDKNPYWSEFEWNDWYWKDDIDM